jgi:hypothetical protein
VISPSARSHRTTRTCRLTIYTWRICIRLLSFQSLSARTFHTSACTFHLMYLLSHHLTICIRLPPRHTPPISSISCTFYPTILLSAFACRRATHLPSHYLHTLAPFATHFLSHYLHTLETFPRTSDYTTCAPKSYCKIMFIIFVSFRYFYAAKREVTRKLVTYFQIKL